MEETAQDPKTFGMIKIIIVSFLAALIISCNGMAVIGYFLFTSFKVSEHNENSDWKDPFTFEEIRSYIEPDIDPESRYLHERAKETFELSYVIDENSTYHETLEDFILVNLQQNYEELVAVLDTSIPQKINITVTDSQDWYEIQLGFDYDDDLPYAGLSTYRDIVILVTENIDEEKSEFNKILKHELVHVFQFERFDYTLVDFPNWFLEGSADYFSDAEVYPLYYYDEVNLFYNLEILSDAFVSGKWYESSAGYLVSHRFVRFLGEQYGREKIISLMLNQENFKTFEELFTETFGQDCNRMYEEWYYREIYNADNDPNSNGIPSSKTLFYSDPNWLFIVYNSEFFDINNVLGWWNWQTRMA